MGETYDVAVVGLGAHGSAAAYQLSLLDGVRVVGFDRFRPPHNHGSSHGSTRATRVATFEGEELVAMARRSIEIYRDLGERVGEELFRNTEGLIVGKPGQSGYHGVADPFQRTIDAAKTHDVHHEVLTSGQLRDRYPMLHFDDDETGYLEKDGGILFPEKCISAHLNRAERHGADLRFGETVQHYEHDGAAISLRTDRGNEYSVGTLVLAAGGWVTTLLEPELADAFTLERPLLYWFAFTDPGQYERYRSMPRVGWAYGSGTYAFPALDGPAGGIKVSCEDTVPVGSPEEAHRELEPAERDALGARMYEQNVRHRFPGVSGRCLRVVPCVYTMTPDSKFVVDVHPEHDNVVVAAACSGHGFKHSAAIGEIAAQLATGRPAGIDTSSIGFERFHGAAEPSSAI